MKPLDWRLDRLFCAVALFDDLSVMEEALARFGRFDWVVHEFDCERFLTQDDLLNAVLQMRDCEPTGHVFENIPMILFWDLLRDFDIPEDTGLVLAFKNTSSFKPQYPEFIMSMLSSIAQEHYYWLKRRGRRLMACAHVADRDIELKPLFSVKAHWNEMSGYSEEADRKSEALSRFMTIMREVRTSYYDKSDPYRRPFKTSYLEYLLQRLTGANDHQALADMNLSMAEIQQLLTSEEANLIWDVLSRHLTVMLEVEQRHSELENYGSTRKLHTKALLQATGAADEQALAELDLSADEVIKILRDFDFGTLKNPEDKPPASREVASDNEP